MRQKLCKKKKCNCFSWTVPPGAFNISVRWCIWSLDNVSQCHVALVPLPVQSEDFVMCFFLVKSVSVSVSFIPAWYFSFLTHMLSIIII